MVQLRDNVTSAEWQRFAEAAEAAAELLEALDLFHRDILDEDAHAVITALEQELTNIRTDLPRRCPACGEKEKISTAHWPHLICICGHKWTVPTPAPHPCQICQLNPDRIYVAEGDREGDGDGLSPVDNPRVEANRDISTEASHAE